MAWSEAVIASAVPSAQEPSLDPRPILELPLDRLVQKLWDEELSLESVLCSYLEEVGFGVRTGVGTVTCCPLHRWGGSCDILVLQLPWPCVWPQPEPLIPTPSLLLRH